jgi:GDP-L-fucose synthase
MPAELHYPLQGRRIWVAGHTGMVGSAIVRRLAGEGCEVLTAGRADCDLRRQSQVEAWIDFCRPDAIVLAAARVGGIHANDIYPADFIYENLIIEANVVQAAHQAGVGRLLLLGSSCIYPKAAPQPITEDALLTGPLEETNQWYAVAKIAGVKLVQAYRRQHGRDYISAMPTNLYGAGDNYDLVTSHVMGALIRKVHEAKTQGQTALAVWGSGRPRREFLHVDDAADALVHLLKTYSGEDPINVGSGLDVTIDELAATICKVIGFDGGLVHDPGKPDGVNGKLMSVARLRAMGWAPRISLEDGIARAYADFLANPPP